MHRRDRESLGPRQEVSPAECFQSIHPEVLDHAYRLSQGSSRCCGVHIVNCMYRSEHNENVLLNALGTCVTGRIITPWQCSACGLIATLNRLACFPFLALVKTIRFGALKNTRETFDLNF